MNQTPTRNPCRNLINIMNIQPHYDPLSCIQLLALLHRNGTAPTGKFTFADIGARDVYNIAAPFELNGVTLLAGRVESRDTELSEVYFFRQDGDASWKPIPNTPVFSHLQDPCFTFVNDELVLGGVSFPVTTPSGEVIWRMEFYWGKTLATLTPFLTGPDKMKDIRLKQLPDGRIGVLTRPQGETGGRGKIGFMSVDRLEEITPAAIEAAPIFEHLFRPEEWGGANEVHNLKNGKLGVLGHIAYFDNQEHRHYYPMVFCVDPATGTATTPHIIAQRKDFPAGDAKRPDLVDVIFSGGLHRNGDGTATLYAGLSDAEAGWLVIKDPFLAFESP
jgi:hypothetical protein